MKNHFMHSFLTAPVPDASKAAPVREKLERRTTTREFKNQMTSIASSGHFSVAERLKAFRNASLKSDQR